MDNNQEGNKAPTAFLVDLVSNRKTRVVIPRCSVGKDDHNDIVISSDHSISPFHFIIISKDGEFSIEDDARNVSGTSLNGTRITGGVTLHDGDVLTVGRSLLWFVLEAA